jgi:hypothetical protein
MQSTKIGLLPPRSRSHLKVKCIKVYISFLSIEFKPLQCFYDNLAEMITIMTPLAEHNNQVTTLKVRSHSKVQCKNIYSCHVSSITYWQFKGFKITWHKWSPPWHNLQRSTSRLLHPRSRLYIKGFWLYGRF